MTRHVWTLPRRVPAVKGVAAVAFIAAGVLTGGDPPRLVVAGIAALALAASAVRDLAAPVRLAADTSGVTVVVGFARQRTIPWADVERVRVDVTKRFGLRKELLEIDAGDTLHLVSPTELGAEPHQVATVLTALRTGHGNA